MHVNPNIDWDLVSKRLLLTDIPERIKTLMEKQLPRVNECTVNSWGDQWIANLKENVKLCDFKKHSAYQWKNKFQGRTFFLIGNGPSLKYNIGILKEKIKKENGVVMASGHGLKYLLENNIKPDFISMVDAKFKTVGFLDVGDAAKDVKLLACVESHPECFKVWKGPVWFFTGHPKETDVPIHKKLNEISDFNDMFSCGGSVMGANYYAADGMGAAKVIFVGMDLANGFEYRANYASGEVDKGEIQPDDNEHEIERKNKGMVFADNFIDCDIQGKGTFTLTRMYNYKYWFDRRSMDRSMEHINCTEGGILGSYVEGNLKSIKQMRLEEV